MFSSLVTLAPYGEVSTYQGALYNEYGVTPDQHRRLVHEFGAHDTLGICEAVVGRLELAGGSALAYREPDGLNYR